MVTAGAAAVDSSVVVAGVLAGHPEHEPCRAVLRDRPLLPAHAAVEAYAVLTRLPAPLRQAPATAATLLRANFDGRVVDLGRRSVLGFVEDLAAWQLAGGAVYDALIGETARRAGATLVTRDARAAATYRAVGVRVELLEP
jgi:predicted nucleic acid-binding protein